MTFDPLPDLDNANVGNAGFICGSCFGQGCFRFFILQRGCDTAVPEGRMEGERLLSRMDAMGTRVSG